MILCLFCFFFYFLFDFELVFKLKIKFIIKKNLNLKFFKNLIKKRKKKQIGPVHH